MNPSTLLFLSFAAAGSAAAVPEGFVIKEFAGPPNADYPTAITAAANGDVYVSSDQNGSLGHKPGMGRIIRCRDTNGDGKADEFIHFVPNVDSPRGGHFVGDTLYLIHPPFLSSYRDKDGDGKVDEEKVLLTGLGGGIEHPRGADHTTNGVRMGIDGWLYISVGDFGTTPAKGTDGSTYTLYGGGVIRVRPDGTGVEPYAVMTRNICDTAISRSWTSSAATTRTTARAGTRASTTTPRWATTVTRGCIRTSPMKRSSRWQTTAAAPAPGRCG